MDILEFERQFRKQKRAVLNLLKEKIRLHRVSIEYQDIDNDGDTHAAEEIFEIGYYRIKQCNLIWYGNPYIIIYYLLKHNRFLKSPFKIPRYVPFSIDRLTVGETVKNIFYWFRIIPERIKGPPRVVKYTRYLA